MERCIAAFFGPKLVDSASKRLQHMGQSRSSVLLLERHGAFSDILHTNPHLVGRSHPVSVEVREFDWDSSRKGASQLSRTRTIRLSTPKTTTGEILIFALKGKYTLKSNFQAILSAFLLLCWQKKTTSLCYVSFYVRCSVFHLGYVSLYVRCSVLDLPTIGSRVLCTCTADIVFSACSPRIRVRMCMREELLPSLELLLA